MSALSRGLGLGLALSQRTFCSSTPRTAGNVLAREGPTSVAHGFRQSPIVQAARNLQTTASLGAKPPQPKASPQTTTTKQTKQTKQTPQRSRPPTPPTASPLSPPQAGAYKRRSAVNVAAQRLGSFATPTELYAAPSHTWMTISSVSAGVFCASYAAWNYWNTVAHPPEGLAWWVPHGYGVICALMAWFGWRFLYGSMFLVRRVTAVPRALVPPSYLRPGAATAAALKDSPIALEIELKTFPMVPPRKIIAAPSQVLLPHRMQTMPAAREPPPPRQGIIDGPFAGLKRGLVREGFLPIKVNGKKYTIDVSPGAKLLHGGKGIDSVVTCRPESFGAGTWLEKIYK